MESRNKVSSSSSNANRASSDVIMISTAEEAMQDNSSIIYIIVGCSLGLVVILLALASAAYVRTRKGSPGAEASGFLHV